ncbi:hypothetical protein [Stenotrophomonas sp. MMGLT7]|uniref:hypothetical protein n=1 Tax=Stenotrophomonas sp. MMGLT7 TaxID=2901227 RepID=UPI001E43A68C|nr:hypothetical protein [Stenotrophomonas sp. MMGLT7]MCD7096943.1 hypothetical protein [Stenotrophomonas sp. MMGLT7]
MERTKTLQLRIKSAGDPSAEQLAQIRQYTLADLPAEQLYVRTFALAHNAIDRDRECFDEALLADYARTLPGKGLFIKHPTSWDGDGGPGKGRWFAAQLDRMSLDEARTLLREPDLKFPPGAATAVVLMASAYLVRTAGNADLLAEIDAGVVGDVSIGSTVKDRERLVDEQGNELNAWRLTGPGEALEGSLVWLGAQPGARAVKGARRDNERDNEREESNVDIEKKLKDATDQVTDLTTKLAAAEPSHGIMQAARKALGDHAHLLDKPDELAASVKAAAAYREELVDKVVAAERQVGLCGDDDESVAAAKAIYMGDPLERLQARAKRADTALIKGGRMPGTSGGSRAADAPETDASKAALADNPALA